MAGERRNLINTCIVTIRRRFKRKIDKSKILEHNVVTGYHINPLGLQQVEHDIEMLDDIMSSTNYPESL